MKLIYHRCDGEVSPFDAALRAVSRGAADLRLASPYVGVGYLQNVLAAADQWRMLTDLEAWLTSGNRMHRAQSWQFIRGNLNYADASLSRRLGLDPVRLARARRDLLALDLIAFEPPLYQVLSLPERVPIATRLARLHAVLGERP